MNLDRFVEELSKTPRDWGYSDIIERNSLRRYAWIKDEIIHKPIMTVFCPITSVCYQVKGIVIPVASFRKAARLIEIDDDLRNLILRVADDLYNEPEQETRNLILSACGLKVEV